MNVIIFVDYSDYTEKILLAAGEFLGNRSPQPGITVVHVIDQTILFAGTGAEQVIMEELMDNGKKIRGMAVQYFGGNCRYVEEYGVPLVKIDEILESMPYDLLVIGTKGRSQLANVLLGSVAEHILHHVKTPLLVVPR